MKTTGTSPRDAGPQRRGQQLRRGAVASAARADAAVRGGQRRAPTRSCRTRPRLRRAASQRRPTCIGRACPARRPRIPATPDGERSISRRPRSSNTACAGAAPDSRPSCPAGRCRRARITPSRILASTFFSTRIDGGGCARTRAKAAKTAAIEGTVRGGIAAHLTIRCCAMRGFSPVSAPRLSPWRFGRHRLDPVRARMRHSRHGYDSATRLRLSSGSVPWRTVPRRGLHRSSRRVPRGRDASAPHVG